MTRNDQEPGSGGDGRPATWGIVLQLIPIGLAAIIIYVLWQAWATGTVPLFTRKYDKLAHQGDPDFLVNIALFVAALMACVRFWWLAREARRKR